MKFIVSVLLTALLAFAAGLYLPWWSIAIASFLVASVLYQKPLLSFLCGFTAIFLLWGILAWLRSAGNNHILAAKASLLILKTENPVLLILVTGLIGAVTGGLAAWSGTLFRRIIKK
ncbi:MAG: hypothetical protein SFU87_14755 [Chitinophagaceae bacterium]|nr:hypothetical protein [Chitinophagaceae bacterium]